jgi:hypothetical protein
MQEKHQKRKNDAYRLPVNEDMDTNTFMTKRRYPNTVFELEIIIRVVSIDIFHV